MESSRPDRGFARRGLSLEIGMGPTCDVGCLSVDRSESEDSLLCHRLSVHSALSQADTPTYARSSLGFSRSDQEDGVLSQEETRDAFTHGDDAMCLEGAPESSPISAGSIYVSSCETSDSSFSRSIRRRCSDDLMVDSPRAKSVEWLDVHDEEARMQEIATPQLGIRSRSWAENSCLDDNNQYRKKLKTLNSTGSAVGEISVETLAALLTHGSKLKELYDHVYVIDCRYQYEFEGGHVAKIPSSDCVSVHNFAPHQVEEAREFLFGAHRKLEPLNDRVCVIFHCEFSQKRGPAMLEKMRAHDRNANFSNWPAVYYPEFYVMKGGYKTFFASFSHLCEPQCYVPEQDERFSKVKKSNHRLSRTKSGGKGLQFQCDPPSSISPMPTR